MTADSKKPPKKSAKGKLAAAKALILEKVGTAEKEARAAGTPIPDPTGERLLAEGKRIIAEAKTEQERGRKLGEKLSSWLRQHGSMIIDKDNITSEGCYWMDTRYKPQLRSMVEEETKALLARKCGESENSANMKAAFDMVSTMAKDPEGTPAQRAELSVWWDRRGSGADSRIFISSGPELVRCSKEGVSVVPMGTEGVLIPSRRALPPWELKSVRDSVFADQLLSVKESGLEADDQLFWALYLCALPMCRPYEAPPIALEGPPQSGKTTMLRQSGRLFAGDEFSVSDPTGQDAERAHSRLLAYNRFVAWDNLDNPRKISWFADKLASSSTGASSNEKTHYKNAGVTNLPIRAAQTLSAINCDFLLRLSTLSTRLLVLKWKSVRSSFNSSRGEDDLIEKRDAVLSWIAHTIAQALKGWRDDDPISFRFDYWNRCFLNVARAHKTGPKAAEVLKTIIASGRERGVSAGYYGSALYEALKAGENLSGKASVILNRLCVAKPPAEYEPSTTGFAAWIGNARPVLTDFDVVITLDPHTKNNTYSITRRA